jgi:hypothetical protein
MCFFPTAEAVLEVKQHPVKRQKPTSKVPQEDTSKDTGPQFHKPAKFKCKCEEKWKVGALP